MMSVLIGLWIAGLGQISDDLPDAIKQKIEAAAKADESGAGSGLRTSRRYSVH